MILIAGILSFMSSLGISDSYNREEIKERIQDLREKRNEIRNKNRKLAEKVGPITRKRNKHIQKYNRRYREGRDLWSTTIQDVQKQHKKFRNRDDKLVKKILRFGNKITNQNNKRQRIDNKLRELKERL